MSAYKKPLIILGAGSRKNFPSLLQKIEAYGIPFVCSWAALDLVPSDHPLNIGTFGITGSRAGNAAIQESDLLMVVGASLNQMQTGLIEHFAPNATRVDISYLEMLEPNAYGEWVKLNKMHSLKEILVREDDWDVSPLGFMSRFNELTREGDVVFVDAGATLCWAFQGIRVKKGMRVISDFNFSCMGSALPMAIGGYLANPKARVFCLIGDYSILMSIQELATAHKNEIPIKVFVFNNRNQGIQCQTMETWLPDGRKHGATHDSGLPELYFEKIADAFSFYYMSIESNHELMETDTLEFAFNSNTGVFLDVKIDPQARISPMLKAGMRLEEL